jgi:antitoxin component of RelBE/YafQ-DinJ toxin-antitoxin module
MLHAGSTSPRFIPRPPYASVKKTKCVTIDASLLAEAEEAAARLGIPLSTLVEEALRRLLRQAEAWRGVEKRLAAVEDMLKQCLQKAVETRREPAEARGQSSRSQEPPPQLGDNLWVSILRKRG